MSERARAWALLAAAAVVVYGAVVLIRSRHPGRRILGLLLLGTALYWIGFSPLAAGAQAELRSALGGVDRFLTGGGSHAS